MTMDNLLGTGQALDSSTNTLITEFRMLHDVTGVFRSMATLMPLKPHEGTSKRINNYGRFIAYDVADGVAAEQSQALSDTTTVFTPGEVAVHTVLPGSTVRRIADPDLLRRTARMLNAAYDLKEDQDGGLQMVNFNPIMGVAGNILGPHEYMGAITRLLIGNSRANPEPPPEPYYLVDHPIKLATLALRLVPLTDVPSGTSLYTPATRTSGLTVGPGSNEGLSDEIIKRHLNALGEFGGVTVKYSANLIPNASDDVSGAVFCKEGFNYVSELEPKLETENLPVTYRGAKSVIVWGSYAWGLYRPDAYGVEILGQAAMPVAS